LSHRNKETDMTRAEAIEQNVDAAHREIARRAAEGEDVSQLVVNPVTAAIVTIPVLAGDAEALTNPRNRVDGMRAERRAVALLIAHLAAKGFALTGASDGEARERCTTAKEAMEVVFSVDESWLYFRNPAHAKGHTVYIVLGNADDGSEVAADFSMGDGFDDAIDELFDAITA
jgi:hypothetical protein